MAFILSFNVLSRRTIKLSKISFHIHFKVKLNSLCCAKLRTTISAVVFYDFYLKCICVIVICFTVYFIKHFHLLIRIFLFFCVKDV